MNWDDHRAAFSRGLFPRVQTHAVTEGMTRDEQNGLLAEGIR